MEELFIINDYDTGEPFEYILTDNAIGCKKTLEEFEKRKRDCDSEDEYDELEWDDFYEMLDKKHINYKVITNIEKYDYQEVVMLLGQIYDYLHTGDLHDYPLIVFEDEEKKERQEINTVNKTLQVFD